MVHNHNDRREPSKLRARLHQSRHDTRGIALQTVIIMVVLLAIAGAIAAVLLGRASEVTGELESQDVTATRIDTQSECENHKMGDDERPGVWKSTGTTWSCTWTDDMNIGGNVTSGRCSLIGGTFDDKDAGAEECKVDNA